MSEDKPNATPNLEDLIDQSVGQTIKGLFPSRKFKDVAPHHIGNETATGKDLPPVPVVLEEPLPKAVEKITETFIREWTETVLQCRQRADELREAAFDLDERADKLQDAIEKWPEELKGCVLFDIRARRRCQSLVNIHPLVKKEKDNGE